MKLLSHSVLATLLLLLWVSCQNNTPCVDSVWELLQNNKPDSALTILDKYALEDFTSRKDKAEYALLKSIALDKSYIDLESDSLIRIALDYYDTKGNDRERMLSWYYLGRVYANAKDFNRAIVAITKAEEYSEHVEDLYSKALIYMAKENIYSHSHNYAEALTAAKKGTKTFEEADVPEQALLAKRRLALDYIAIHDFASADSLLLGIIENDHADSSLVGRCILNYAWSLALQKKYPESLVYFEEGTSKYHTSMSLPQLEEYGVALYQTGQDEKADALRDRLKDIPSAKASFMLLSLQSCRKTGRYEEALELQRKLIQREDSIAVKTMEQSVIKTQREYQKQSKEIYRLESEKRKLTSIVFVFLSLLLILAFILTLRISQKSHRQKTERLMASQEEIKKMLVEAHERNSTLNDELELTRKQYVSAYKKRYSKIAHLSETYYLTSGSRDSREKVYREVRDLSSFITKDIKTYRQLEKNVNNNLSDAMLWFRKEYPDLEESTYRFVCYLMAGFPASTISLLTGLTPSNIYVRKNRLLEDIQSGSTEHRDLFLLVI